MTPESTLESSFQSSSLGWQIQKLSQRIGEWIEYQFYRLQPPDLSDTNVPEWTLPEALLRFLFWGIVAALLTWLIWQLFLLLSPYFRTLRSRTTVFESPGSAAKRPELSVNQWWQRAQTYQRQGNYQEACRALYLGMIQHLHDRHLIPQRDSYTDGDYRTLLKTLPKSTPCNVLIETHEAIVFGDRPASQTMLERCQQAYREMSGG